LILFRSQSDSEMFMSIANGAWAREVLADVQPSVGGSPSPQLPHEGTNGLDVVPQMQDADDQ
jgi:hypothetical protein